jgi:chromosome segregation ATPase
MSGWTDGWEDDDVQFDDDLENDVLVSEEPVPSQPSGPLGRWSQFLTNVATAVDEEEQAHQAAETAQEEEQEPAPNSPMPVTLLASRLVTSILSPANGWDEEGWEEEDIDLDHEQVETEEIQPLQNNQQLETGTETITEPTDQQPNGWEQEDDDAVLLEEEKITTMESTPLQVTTEETTFDQPVTPRLQRTPPHSFARLQTLETPQMTNSVLAGWDDDALEHLDISLTHQNDAAGDAAAVSPLSQQGMAPPLSPLTRTTNNFVVDQVPAQTFPAVAQRDSTIAMASDHTATLDDDEEEDHQIFGPVVDHLPPPSTTRQSSKSLSVATLARLEDMDQDDKEVGEDTEPGELTTEGLPPTPVVVDHVPSSSNTLATSATVVAVASQQSSTVMEDIWREDFDPNDEDYGPVVDRLPARQTPTPSIRSLKSISSSLAVPGAIAEEEDDDDGEGDDTDSNKERRYYNKVGIFSGASVADSMAVVAPIAEQHDEDDEENTATLEDDDETVSNAAPSLTTARPDEPLVDHVPFRPGRGPTDASTLVLVDPSEVSTVGDMTYEDMQYGPVVDHTPPPGALSYSAAAGASMIVAATKSECPDDFEEDDMDGETYAMGTGDDGATLETSLGDAMNDDHLVDHVPEAPTIRRVNSSSAIAEAVSVISARDDEFGQIVDHTPLPRDSVLTLAPLSECETLRSEELSSLPGSQIGRRVEVENVPVSSSMSRTDSAYAVKSPGDDESQDFDTIEENPAADEFGPVVDHLPSVSTPIASSRGGGSTNAALATLSELDLDGGTADAEAEGWEEDDQELQDIETNEDSAPEAEEDDKEDTETPETRNKSVTFQNLEGVPLLPIPYDTSKPSYPLDGEDDSNVGSNSRSLMSPESVECRLCSESNTLDCPCVQRILASGGENAAIVRRITPDGLPIDVDFNKLLQDEVTKRLLLEKEVEKYQLLVDSLRSSSTQALSQGAQAQNDARRLEDLNSQLSQRLQGETLESTTLRGRIADLESQVQVSQDRVEELWRGQQAALEAAEALRLEMSDLITQRGQSSAEAASEFDRVKKELSDQVCSLREENEVLRGEICKKDDVASELKAKHDDLTSAESKLSEEIRLLKSEREEHARQKEEAVAAKEMLLRDESERISRELGETSEKLHSLQLANEQLSSTKHELEQRLFAAERNVARSASKEIESVERESKYKEEIEKLQQMASEAASAKDLERHFQDKISLLQTEAKKKSDEIEALRGILNATEIKLSESEAKNFAQMKESARFDKDKQIRMATLEDELVSVRSDHKAELDSRDAKEAAMEKKMNEILEELHHVMKVKEELKDRVQALLETVEDNDKLQEDLRRLEQERKSRSEHELRQQEAHSKALAEAEGEIYSLRSAHAEAASTIEALKHELTSMRNEKNNNSKDDGTIESLKLELSSQAEVLSKREARIRLLENDIEEAKVLNDDLSVRSKQASELHDLVHNLKNTISSLEQDAQLYNQEQRELQSRLSSLSEELSKATLERDQLQRLCAQQQDTIMNLQDELRIASESKAKFHVHSQDFQNQIHATEKRLQATMEQLQSRDDREGQLRADIDMLLAERDNLLSEKRALEEDSEEMLVQLGLDKEHLDLKEKEIAALHDALRSTERINVQTTDSLHVAEEKIRQLELEKANSDLKPIRNQNGNMQREVVEELRQEIENLTIENADLRQQIDDLSSSKAFSDEEVHRLANEVQILRDHLQDFEAQGTKLTDVEAAKIEYYERANELERRASNLDTVCKTQKEEINRLLEALRHAEEARQSSLASSVSTQRIPTLEMELSHKQELIQEKEQTIQELRQQLEHLCHLSSIPENKVLAEMSDAIDFVNLRLRESEQLGRTREAHMDTLEIALAAARADLLETKNKLSTTEDALMKLQTNVDPNKEENHLREYYETLLAESRQSISHLKLKLHRAEEHNADLDDRLDATTNGLSSHQRLLQDKQELSNIVAEKEKEIELLKVDILKFQQTKATSAAANQDKDEAMGKEIVSLRDSIKKKSDKLANLEQQLSTISVELSTAKSLLSSKDEELERVSLELEDTRAQQLEETQRVAARVLESDMSREEAESTDNMRQLIISLSQALEKSEIQRADAVERLLRERKTNADSLKRLGDSVKRFYMTLNGGSP